MRVGLLGFSCVGRMFRFNLDLDFVGLLGPRRLSFFKQRT